MIAALLIGPAVAQVPPPGLYVLETEVVTQSQVSIFGRNRVVTTARALAEVAESDDGLRLHQTTCSIEVVDGSRAITTIPPLFIQSLPRLEYRLEANESGFVLRDGEQRVGLVGTPAQFPTSPRDPAVADTDGDGRPGATIELRVPVLGTIDIYVVQRTRTELAGSYVDGRGAGQVNVLSFEQVTIGASNPLFRVTPNLAPQSEESAFLLIPVDSGTRCADL